MHERVLPRIRDTLERHGFLRADAERLLHAVIGFDPDPVALKGPEYKFPRVPCQYFESLFLRSDRRLVRDVLLDVFSLEDCIAHDTKAVQLRTQDSIYEFSEGSNWRKAQMHFSADISSGDTVRVTIEGSRNSLNTFKFEHSCTWLKNRYGRKRYEY